MTIFSSYQKDQLAKSRRRKTLKNYFFNKSEQPIFIFSLYFLLVFFSQKSEAQILITNTQNNLRTLNQVKKILLETLLVPSSLVEKGHRKNCRVEPGDEKYDLVVCIKKNGELKFPIYKQAILKNSYQTFLN